MNHTVSPILTELMTFVLLPILIELMKEIEISFAAHCVEAPGILGSSYRTRREQLTRFTDFCLKMAQANARIWP